MAYEPTNWQAGDVVTSAKLNKIEQGIASHDIVEGIVDEENGIITLNKTWQEIWDNNYTSIMSIETGKYKEFKSIHEIGMNEDSYEVIVVLGSDHEISFICDSPDSYPSYNLPSGGQDDKQ